MRFIKILPLMFFTTIALAEDVNDNWQDNYSQLKYVSASSIEQLNNNFESILPRINASKYLKSGNSFEKLDLLANNINDNESAKLLQLERKKLFDLIFEQNN